MSIEVVDSSGSGFRTLLDIAAALDMSVRIAVSVARLRRLPGTVP